MHSLVIEILEVKSSIEDHVSSLIRIIEFIFCNQFQQLILSAVARMLFLFLNSSRVSFIV